MNDDESMSFRGHLETSRCSLGISILIRSMEIEDERPLPRSVVPRRDINPADSFIACNCHRVFRRFAGWPNIIRVTARLATRNPDLATSAGTSRSRGGDEQKDERMSRPMARNAQTLLVSPDGLGVGALFVQPHLRQSQRSFLGVAGGTHVRRNSDPGEPLAASNLT